MKKMFLFGLCIVIVGLMLSANVMAASLTFTENADWNLGTLTSTTTDPPPDTGDGHIRLEENLLTQFNHIWVALSGRDGVARIDTDYVEPTIAGEYDGDQHVTLTEMTNAGGPVMGEYLSHPNGRAGNPSRTTTDLNGDVWVGNRNEAGGGQGSAVKISANPTGTTSSGIWNGSTFDRLGWNNAGNADSNGGTSTAQDTAIEHHSTYWYKWKSTGGYKGCCFTLPSPHTGNKKRSWRKIFDSRFGCDSTRDCPHYLILFTPSNIPNKRTRGTWLF